MYLLGFDLGSSFIKASLLEPGKQRPLLSLQAPAEEMAISSPQRAWAEQNPEMWWDVLGSLSRRIISESGIDASEIKGIGISYQMHGLILLDQNNTVIRPAIIWCDSRAHESGEKIKRIAEQQLGSGYFENKLLNDPDNFTLSKLFWVKENEAAHFQKVKHIMLPGDYISYKLSGQLSTTQSALSEGILWNYKKDLPATELFKTLHIDLNLIPEVLPAFAEHGKVNYEASQHTGIPAGVPITYKAGDQPNNALSVGAIDPGQVAATAGTSGVLFAVGDKRSKSGRGVNQFLHVNHQNQDPRIGSLLCINGCGIQYAWLRRNFAHGSSYESLEEEISSIPIGSESLLNYPFGNGQERMLEANPGASFIGLDFNRHQRAHFLRAALEGIAFSFRYGSEEMESFKCLRAPMANLFQSATFAQTMANLLNCPIELVDRDGAHGAALAAGIIVGYSSWDQIRSVSILKTYKVEADRQLKLQSLYEGWKFRLEH